MQTNTAKELLDLVFEGHHIRTVFQNGKPLFVAKDVFAAAEMKAPRDAYRRLDEYERVSSEVDTLGGKQTMTCLTESGVYHVLFASQKPAAVKLRRWLAEEVLPQLLTYGSYIPGANAAERITALRSRWLTERQLQQSAGEAILASSGLMTLRAFRLENAIPARDALSFARRLQITAKLYGATPTKIYTHGKKLTNAWPPEILRRALNCLLPKLPFPA